MAMLTPFSQPFPEFETNVYALSGDCGSIPGSIPPDCPDWIECPEPEITPFPDGCVMGEGEETGHYTEYVQTPSKEQDGSYRLCCDACPPAPPDHEICRIGFVDGWVLECCNDPGYQTHTDCIWLSFDNIDIPKPEPGVNVTINKAVIEFVAFDDYTDESIPVTRVYAEDRLTNTHGLGSLGPSHDDFSPYTEEIKYYLTDWVKDQTYRTPNLACIVQTIIENQWYDPELGHAGGIKFFWEPGGTPPIDPNSTGTFDARRIYDAEDDQSKMAKLLVWYSLEYASEVVGGVEVGGSATVYDTIHARGGVEVGGDASPDVSFLPSVSGGVEVGGSATVESLGASGGVVVGGSATANDILTMRGGVVVGRASHPNGYAYRMKIVVPPGAVAEDFEKFYLGLSVRLDPVQVETGSDFLVTDMADTVLVHELRHYDADTGRLHLFVKTPLSTEGNNFWIYWGRE